MKSFFALAFLVSQISFAQTSNQVQPTPVDKPPVDADVKGAIVEPTPEQKAAVKPPVKAKKAKKKKKSKKAVK
jgi:hypothetical protein